MDCCTSTEIILTWSSLVEGDAGLYGPNCQANLVIVIYEVSSIILRFYIHNSLPLGPI